MYIWAEKGSWLQDVPCTGARPDLTLGLPPGSLVCPAWALPRLMPQRGHPAPEELWSLPGLLMAREPEPEAGRGVGWGEGGARGWGEGGAGAGPTAAG